VRRTTEPSASICLLLFNFLLLLQNLLTSLVIIKYISLHLCLLGAAIACLIRVLLYRRNVHNFVKRHSELITIFLKKIEKNREYITVGNSHVEYLLTVIRDVIRSRQPAKISGNSSCHRRLLFLFKKNNERNISPLSMVKFLILTIFRLVCSRVEKYRNLSSGSRRKIYISTS
jgi:hypothetical protein